LGFNAALFLTGDLLPMRAIEKMNAWQVYISILVAGTAGAMAHSWLALFIALC